MWASPTGRPDRRRPSARRVLRVARGQPAPQRRRLTEVAPQAHGRTLGLPATGRERDGSIGAAVVDDQDLEPFSASGPRCSMISPTTAGPVSRPRCRPAARSRAPAQRCHPPRPCRQRLPQEQRARGWGQETPPARATLCRENVEHPHREGPVPVSSAPVRRSGFRRWSTEVCDLAAAHLQGPMTIMHVWTTSLPWCPRCSTRWHRRRGGTSRSRLGTLGRWTDRTDRPEVAELGLDHRVHLLGQIRIPRRAGALDDVGDLLGATDDDWATRAAA